MEKNTDFHRPPTSPRKRMVGFILNIFIHLPNSLKLIIGSRSVRKYNLNTYK